MHQLLADLQTNPSDQTILLDILQTMNRKLNALQNCLIALEPALPDAQKSRLRAILAQELLLED